MRFKISKVILLCGAICATSIFYCKELAALNLITLSSEPGFEGLYRKEEILPLKITIENHEGEPTRGEIVLSGTIMKYILPVELPPYSKLTKWILIYPQTNQNPLLRFTSKEGLIVEKDVHLTISSKREAFVIYITQRHEKIAYLSGLFDERYHLFEISPEDLWDIWQGYKQADFVLLDTPAIEIMTEPQWNALKRYILAGGRLYITGYPYPEIYNHPFLRDILPARVNGLSDLEYGFLYPVSPQVTILTLKAGTRNDTLFHKIKGIPLWSERKLGVGDIILLSFDPADRTFHPWIKKGNSLGMAYTEIEKYRGRKKRITHFPEKIWSKEIHNIFLNMVRWNICYLILFIPIGLLGIKGHRRTFWLTTVIWVLIGSLSATGSLNGKNLLRGVTVLNIYQGEKEAFLQSRVDLLSTQNRIDTSIKVDDFYLYPLEGINGNYEIKLLGRDSIQNFMVYSGMLEHRTFALERFETFDNILNFELKVYNDNIIRGRLQNLSQHRLINPFIWINGRSFPMPSIESGEKISVQIENKEGNPIPYQATSRWLKEYLNHNRIKNGHSLDIKIVGYWERPFLEGIGSDISIEEETTIIIYQQL